MGGPPYDVIVLGLGGMGSAALYQLARRGARACGVEQFGVAHAFGSSHGATRVIRKAYMEHPGYAPLLRRAYELWRELEGECGVALLRTCGVLLNVPRGSASHQGLEACYREHDLPHEVWTPAEAMAHFPQFRLDRDSVCFWDPEGGYLFVESCVEQALARAEELGAEILIHKGVNRWGCDAGHAWVEVDGWRIEAGALIITAGPWAIPVLEEAGARLELRRKIQLWYDSPVIDQFREPAFPVFYVETGGRAFYGFPAMGDAGLKAAEHTGGDPVADPNALDRSLRPEDEAPVTAFLRAVFPGLEPSLRHFSACMYTMSPDGHFIVDRHPAYERVYLAAGFSGHGFKFASVIGEVLAGLALDGVTAHDVGFLRLERFGVRGR